MIRKLISIYLLSTGLCFAQYSARTDKAVVQYPSPLPNVGNLTGAGTIVKDPNFRTYIIRVTDANTNPALVNHSFDTTTSGSSDQEIWNTNSTFFALGDDGGGLYPYSFNPNTMQASRLYASSYPSSGGLRIGSQAGTWSHVVPTTLYFKMLTGGEPLVESMDFSNLTQVPTATTIYNFATSSSNCLPSQFNGGTQWGDDPWSDYSDVEFGGAWSTGGQGTGTWVTVYKIGYGCTWYNTQTQMVGGDWGQSGSTGLPDAFYIHNTRITKDGNWMVIANASCISGYTCQGPIYYWQIGTTNVTICKQGNDCSGHWTEGYTHWVNDPDLMVTTIRKAASPLTYSFLVASIQME